MVAPMQLLVAQVFGAGTSMCEDRFARTVSQVFFVVIVEYCLLQCIGATIGSATSGYWFDHGGFAVEKYLKQVFLWLACVSIAEGLTALLLLSGADQVEEVSSKCLLAVSWSSGLELVVVGIILPLFGTVAKVWVTDEFLRVESKSLGQAVLSLFSRAKVAGGKDLKDPLLKAESGEA